MNSVLNLFGVTECTEAFMNLVALQTLQRFFGNHGVLNPLALPGIGNMNVAVRRLDNRGIAELATLGLKMREGIPGVAAV